jgi:hypothetical protein
LSFNASALHPLRVPPTWIVLIIDNDHHIRIYATPDSLDEVNKIARHSLIAGKGDDGAEHSGTLGHPHATEPVAANHGAGLRHRP